MDFYECVFFIQASSLYILYICISHVCIHENSWKLLGNYDICHCHCKNEGLAAFVLHGQNSKLNQTIADWTDFPNCSK